MWRPEPISYILYDQRTNFSFQTGVTVKENVMFQKYSIHWNTSLSALHIALVTQLNLHLSLHADIRLYWFTKEVNPFNEAVSLSSRGTAASPALLWLITRGFSLGASIINVAINSDVRKVERSLPSSRRPGLWSICLPTPSASPGETALSTGTAKTRCRVLQKEVGRNV